MLSFNCKKCVCFVAGPASKNPLPPMLLYNEPLVWSEKFKYLGVRFISGKGLNIDINNIKRNFYASCNNILGNLYNSDEIVKLFLCETYCLPLLLYGSICCNLNDTQLRELNVCWNTVVRRIFGFHRWESIREFLWGIGRLDFIHLRLYHLLKFHRKDLSCYNCFLYDFVTKYKRSTDFINTFSSVNALLNNNNVLDVPLN